MEGGLRAHHAGLPDGAALTAIVRASRDRENQGPQVSALVATTITPMNADKLCAEHATRLHREDADGLRIASQPIESNYELVSVARLSPSPLYFPSLPRA